MAKRSRHITSKYRSGLEEEAVAFLSERQVEVKYELLKIEWEDLKYRTYTPDFELDNGILIETKGYFDASDRRKHLAVKKQHPELDIRFVFWNAKAPLSKGAKSRYFEWCDKNGYLWSHRVIPEEWLTEPGSRAKTEKITLKLGKINDRYT